MMFEVLWVLRVAWTALAMWSLFAMRSEVGRKTTTLDDAAARDAFSSLEGLEPTDRGRASQVNRVDHRGDHDLIWACGTTPEAGTDTPLVAYVGAHADFDAQVGPPGIMGKDTFPRVISTRLAPVVARLETPLDRFGCALGLQREHQTGDTDFDARVYIETTAPDELVEALFGSEVVRHRVLHLFDQEYAAVGFYLPSAQLIASMLNPSPRHLQALPAAGDALVDIARNMPHLELPEPIPYDISKGVGDTVFRSWDLAIPGSCVLVGGLLLFLTSGYVDVVNQPLSPGLDVAAMGLGLGVFAAVMAAVVLRNRGTSTGVRTILTWNVALCLIVLWFLPRLVVMGNAMLDASPDQETTIEVREVAYGMAVPGLEHHAIVPPDSPFPGLQRLRLSRGMVSALEGGDITSRRVVVRHGEGAFGVPYVRSITVVE